MEGTRKFSLARCISLFWEEFSNIFLLYEYVSQIKKTFLNKFWGICSESY